MEESKFKVGDVVKLKSGGPVMTVSSEIKDGVQWTYKCIYFHEGRLVNDKECVFPEKMLERG